MKKRIITTAILLASCVSHIMSTTHEMVIKQRLKKTVPSLERRIANEQDPEVKRVLEIIRVFSEIIEQEKLDQLEHETIKAMHAIKHAFMSSVAALAQECPRFTSKEDIREMFAAEEYKFINALAKERAHMMNQFMEVMSALHPFMIT